MKTLAALLLVLCGCVPRAPAVRYAVAISPELSLSDHAVVLSALGSWTDVAPVAFDPTWGACPDPLPPGTICVELGTSARQDALAVTRGRRVVLCPRWREAAEQVVAHELGHAMGLHHGTGVTLMRPYIDDAAPHPTRSDGQALAHATEGVRGGAIDGQ